jgi:glycosyltransferase involved in cell wall biosynthesis
MMHISAFTVCVDYSDYLSSSLALWQATLDSLVVVTSHADKLTQGLCEALGVRVHATDVFYASGAKFNKGAALAEAYAASPTPPDWVLFFDADVIPPPDWLVHVQACQPTPGCLHGCFRDELDGSPIKDPDIAGFFHLAHISDANMQQVPIVDTHWTHAGAYDSTFQNRWPKDKRIRLPLRLIHQGETWKNWCGRGNTDAMQELLANRRRKGGDWKHETI